MIKVLLLIAVALSPTTLAAQQKEAPKQCRAGWTITDNPSKRHERNTGAGLVDLLQKRYYSKPGIEAFHSPPQSGFEYTYSVPIIVDNLPNGGKQFTFNRQSDNAYVIGTVHQIPDGRWQMVLSVQLPGYVTATGLCIE